MNEERHVIDGAALAQSIAGINIHSLASLDDIVVVAVAFTCFFCCSVLIFTLPKNIARSHCPDRGKKCEMKKKN